MLQRLPHSCYMPPSAKSGGFTLIELMVVVMILAILAAFAAPAMQNMIVQNRLAGQTNELLGTIQFARGEAIKRNQSIRFCPVANAGDTACDADAGNWAHWVVALNADDTVLRQGSMPTNLQLSSDLDNNTLIFAPTGLNNVTDGVADTITLCSPTGNGDTTRTIKVRLAGGTTISQSPGCN
ncbi:GspH/FimT family pseudopilin [Azonexus sp.]|uniref:GspH/FimT family pseudopilin n=1 Tax=Azonexus sp. TaxID=1872668 RepID=UPI00283AAB6A|nr:GspH/FimT family pseudopilin [Azonexus sp.]